MIEREEQTLQGIPNSCGERLTVDEMEKMPVSFQQALLLDSEGLSSTRSAAIIGLTPEDQLSLLEAARLDLQGRVFSASIPTLSEDEAREEYLTVDQIASQLGKTWQWAMRNLSLHKDQVRRVIGRGVVNTIVFPARMVDVLESEPEVSMPSNGWLTARQMSDALEVDFTWVVRRLLELPFHGELRQAEAKHGEITVHFPPQSLQYLRKMKDAITSPPLEGEEFTVGRLAKMLNRHPFWVNKKLIQIDAVPAYRRHKSGRVLAYYPYSSLEALKHEDVKYKALGDWATIPVIADAVGMNREWVIGKIEELGISGELREHPNFRRVYISYPRGVIRRLKKFAVDHENPEEGWMTETSIVKMLGRSHNWVRRRIDRMDPARKKRRDERGILRVHYPPEFINALLEIRYDDETGWT